MAEISVNLWHGGRPGWTVPWVIYNDTVNSNAWEWFTTVTVLNGNYPYQIEVDGVMKDIVVTYLVGKKSDVPSGQWQHSCVKSYVAGETGQDIWYATYPTNIMERNGYIFTPGSFGECGIWDEPGYAYSTMADFEQAMDDDEISKTGKKQIWYDVYLNGTQDPSIFVNWTCSDNMNISALTPRVWTECEAVAMTDNEFAFTPSGYRYPNDVQWFLDSAGEYSYAGSFRDSYLGITQHYDSKQNGVEKALNWGLDGKPAFIGLFLRMDITTYDEHGFAMTEWTQLQRIRINHDATYELASYTDSDMFPNIKVHVRFHTGEPDYIPPDDPDDYPTPSNIDDDGPGRYDPDDTPDPADFTDPVGFDGNAVLTRTYAVSDGTLQNVGQKLWTQSYFNVLKIQSNPIENIISVKHYPFSMLGSSQSIKVGDVDFEINGDLVSSVQQLTIGSYTWTGKFKNYLDLSPYTSIKINLPYCGMFSLDPSDIIGSKLTVEYWVDLVTGQCMAKLSLDGKTLEGGRNVAIPYLTVYGQMGVDIPLTSSDRVQTELRAASAAVTAMGHVGGQLISGNVAGGAVTGISDALNIAGSDYTSQRTSSQSPACTASACQDVYLLIETPTADVVEQGSGNRDGYRHLHGYPCHKYKTLGSFAAGSFVQVEKRTDLVNLAATSEENRMLEQLLTEGVYI